MEAGSGRHLFRAGLDEVLEDSSPKRRTLLLLIALERNEEILAITVPYRNHRCILTQASLFIGLNTKRFSLARSLCVGATAFPVKLADRTTQRHTSGPMWQFRGAETPEVCGG
jgi:hypothetical protein